MAGWKAGRRSRGDAQPSTPAAVLLATAGHPLCPAALDEAVRLADGGRVAVVTIARVHGSAFGLPNPGLLPSRREKQEQRDIVQGAMDELARRGLPTDGQIVVTRNASRAFTRIAAVRGVSHVVLQSADHGRIQRLIQENPARLLRRRLPEGALVEVSARA